MKTQLTIARRQTTLETLRNSGALFLWHPLLVDAALDVPESFFEMSELVCDPAFVRAVGKIVSRAPSLGAALGEHISDRLLDPSRSQTGPFLATMRRKALTRMNLSFHANRLLSDEIDERLQFEYLRMADRFTPGNANDDGSVRTFGFKAFLENQLPYKLRDIIRQCLADYGYNESPEEMEELQVAPSSSISTSDLSEVLRKALRKAVRSPREVKLLEAFVCNGDTLAKFSESDASSMGKLRRDLESIFSRAASLLSGEGTMAGAPRLLYCQRALQELVPMSELSSWLDPAALSQASMGVNLHGMPRIAFDRERLTDFNVDPAW